MDGGADVGAARGVIRSFRKSSLVSLDLQGKASTITTPSQRAAAAWAPLSSHKARSGDPTGRSRPPAARGGLRAPGSPPLPPPAQPHAALTGGRSASRPHRARRGPAGWRTAHLRGQRQGGAQGPRSGGRPRSAATATARARPGEGHRDDTGVAPRCRDTVMTLSRRCPPALTVPLRHLGGAPLPSAAAQEVPEAPLAPRSTLPSPLCDWPAPAGGARRLASPAPRPRPSAGGAHKMAAAAVRGLGLGRGVRELRLHLCQSSAGSRGAR